MCWSPKKQTWHSRIKNCVYIRFKPKQTFWTPAILLCSFVFTSSLPHLAALAKIVLLSRCSFQISLILEVQVNHSPQGAPFDKPHWHPFSGTQLLYWSSSTILQTPGITGNAKTFLDFIHSLANYQCVRFP